MIDETYSTGIFRAKKIKKDLAEMLSVSKKTDK
jgi:hypothetical protein